MHKLYLISVCIAIVHAYKTQHVITKCWIKDCYEQHYDSILIEINKNPGYLHHNTIFYYNSLHTTIVYK